MPAMPHHQPDHEPARDRARHMQQLRAQISARPAQPLSEAEARDLQHMREEEKIARDVYLALGQRWALPPLHHIPGSEQAHMDAVAWLLEHHGLPDPVQDLPPGRFHSPAFQTLYHQLIEAGLSSELEAIRVGLLIEELDIVDLQQARERTQNPVIDAVYDDLERGSRNHLRAFFRHLRRHGAHYTPQHLDAHSFERIALSGRESCASAA